MKVHGPAGDASTDRRIGAVLSRFSDAHPHFARRSLPLLVGAALVAGSVPWSLRTAAPAPTRLPSPLAMLEGLPITFEPNRGQFPPEVLYLARGVAGEVALRTGEIAISHRRRDANDAERALRIRFAGANPAPEVESASLARTVSSYYLGNVPGMTREPIAHAEGVRMRDLYPGIDLVVHGRQSELEYDFVVAPGVDPGQIGYDLTHADSVKVDRNGDLVVVAGGKITRHRAPVAWQDIDGQRVPVQVRFRFDRDQPRTAGFEVDRYDTRHALVIDPVLDYSTFMGGTGGNFVGAVQVDAQGMVYMTSHEVFPAGGSSIDFTAVTKFDPVARNIVFNTYIGGAGTDRPSAIAVGASAGEPSVYVAGSTTSNDFPTCLATSDCAGHHGGNDAFLVRVNANTGVLRASWLLGGSGDDFANGVALDAAGFAYITGQTATGFQTTAGALFPNKLGGPADSDAFVLKMDPANGIAYSTLLGGTGHDRGATIAIDAAGNMHVGGSTSSANFPLAGGGEPGPGGFVSKFKPGSALEFSTVLGASGDAVNALALDPRGNGFAVAGSTSDPLFAQQGPVRQHAGGSDAFVQRFGTDAFATLLGSSGNDVATAIAISPSGEIFIGGTAGGPDLPVVAPLPTFAYGPQATFAGPYRMFLARYSPTGPSFTSYFGFANTNSVASLVAPSTRSVIVSGATWDNIPLVNAFKTTKGQIPSVFLTRISFPTAAATRTDFSGNRKADLLWTNTDGRSAIWLMDGTTIQATAEIGAGAGWSVTNLGDFNRDGKADLIWRHTDGRLSMDLMNGITATATQQLLGPGTGWRVTHTPDLDGDGKSDLVFENVDGSVAVWLMNGTTLAASTGILGPGSGWQVTHTADFDGDGKGDLLWTHPDGRVAIWLMDGIAVKATNQILNGGSGWAVTHTPDLNGDGRADLVWQNADGSIAAWLMNGAAMASGLGLLGPGTGWSITRTADFDGDGKDDVFFLHTDGRAAIYLMNGLMPATTTQILNAGGGWSAKRTADLDGDGKADIVWENVNGSTAVWLMNGTTMALGAQLTGPATGWTVSGVSP